MGVQISIAAYCRDGDQAEIAFKAAFAEIAKVESLFSTYRKSDLQDLHERLGHQCEQHLTSEMWPLFDAAHRLAEQTEGRFDYTLGQLTQLWRRTKKKRDLPSPEKLAAAKKVAGYQHVQLDKSNSLLTVDCSDIRFDFGGIAKGYAADLALQALHKHGVHRALVNAAGDIAVGDPPPNKSGWSIAIEGAAPNANSDQASAQESKPQVILVNNCGIATSGEQGNFIEINGHRYSHILDPQTGLGLNGHRLSTVIAPTALESDAYASAFNVMSIDETRAFVGQLEAVHVRVIHVPAQANSRPQLFVSEDFPSANLSTEDERTEDKRTEDGRTEDERTEDERTEGKR